MPTAVVKLKISSSIVKVLVEEGNKMELVASFSHAQLLEKFLASLDVWERNNKKKVKAIKVIPDSDASQLSCSMARVMAQAFSLVRA